MERASTRSRCASCKHAYVTWDAAHPHGCRAFGFQSRRPPAEVVRMSSGAPCQLYEPRPDPRAASRRKG